MTDHKVKGKIGVIAALLAGGAAPGASIRIGGKRGTAQELSAHLAAGQRLYLHVYAGRRPLSPDHGAHGPMLAEVTLEIRHANNREAIDATGTGFVRATGRPTWFRILDDRALPILDGQAGPNKLFDLWLDTEYLKYGSEVTIEAPCDV